MKLLFLFFEDIGWSIRCRYNLWLHGPYGLAKVIEKIPYHFLIKYLRKYGASIGENCRFERGLNIHRPLGEKPFGNLIVENDVYIGHSAIIDLSRRVTIKNKVIIASGCQIWTHASCYQRNSVGTLEYFEKFGEVNIDDEVIIYSGVIISHGITIGKCSRIGANSLVNKNVEPDNFIGGVPAIKLNK